MKTKGTVRLISIILLLIVSVLLIYYFHIIRDTGEVFSHFFYMPIIISILWWREKGLLTTLFLIVVLCTSNFFRETPNIIHDFYRSIPFIIISIIAYSINEKLVKARIKCFLTLGDLQKSKDRNKHLFTMLRLMCDNLPELIWAKDLEGKYIFVNKSCCENLLNAKDTDEPIGKTDLYFAEREKNSHPENPNYNTFGDICTDSDLKTIESKKQTNSDETGSIKGVYTILNVSKAPFWYNSNIIGTIGCARDVTRERNYEKKLTESEERFRSLYENSTIGLYRTTPDGKILLANPALVNMLGYNNFDELAQLNLEKEGFVSGYTRRMFLDKIEKKGEIKGLESAWEKKDGTIIFIRESAKVIYDSNNQVLYYEGTVEDITQRKRIENVLEQSEEKYRTMIEQSNDMIWTLDIDGNLTFFNRQSEEITSHLFKDWEGKSFVPLIVEEDLPMVMEVFQKTLKGEPQRYEVRIKRVDKHIIILSVNTAPILKNKKVVGTVSFGRDITARKQAEEIISKSEAKYRLLAENTIDCVWKMDKDLKFTYINQSILPMLGFTQEEWMGSALEEHCSVKELQYFMSIVENELQKEDTYSSIFELYLFHKDGREVPLEILGKILFDNNKEIIGFQGNARDITERKRAEQIQKVLYNISNAVITTNNLKKLISLIQKELGTIIDTTNFYVALYDHKTDMLSLPFFADEKDKFTSIPAGKTLTSYVIKTKKSLLANIDVKKRMVKEGKLEHVGSLSEIWLGVPLKNEGEVTGVLAVQSYSDENAFNESDMKMLEFVSDQISISIDRKKTEEELIAALKKAEENDRLKTAFLMNMSHEIRTPMNGILGFANLLQNIENSSEKASHYTSIIVNSGNQLLSIIDDILDISRIETGQINLYEEEVALNSVLKDIFSFFKIKTEEKGLNLNLITDLSIKNPIILIDISKLKQIIFNLIGNALKFTEKGSIDFGYKIKGSQLEFFVKDSGIGIPRKYHKDIFNRFNKVENDSVQLFGGTGLGLAICTGLVEKMGGSIWVESDPDRYGKAEGAEFYFTIPYKISTQKKVSGLLENKTKNDLAENIILVVEDEESSAVYLKEILSNRKIKQLLAKDGKQAVEIVKKNPDIDLILMDIKLPLMDGYSATKEIKKINPYIPVIAITSYAMQNDKVKALKAGCDDYISKPISEENLINLINKYLKK